MVTDSFFEIDSKFIKDKLRSILNTFHQGLILKETYDLQSGAGHGEPTLREALKSRDRQKRIEAIREEIDNLIASIGYYIQLLTCAHPNT